MGRSLPFAAFGAEQVESTGALRVEPGLRREYSVLGYVALSRGISISFAGISRQYWTR